MSPGTCMPGYAGACDQEVGHLERMSLEMVLVQRRAEYAEALDRALDRTVSHLANR
jgi:hypothetical protein